MSFESPKFENPVEIEDEDQENERNQKSKLEYQKFLGDQISLPEEEWSDEFKERIKERSMEIKEKESLGELSPEEERKATFERYLKGIDLDIEDIKDKKILDLGCGEEAEFIKECLEGGITDEVYGLDANIEEDEIEEDLKEHILKGDFEQELPKKDLDLVISIGALRTPDNESDPVNLKATLENSLRSLKEDGEIRIWPIFKSAPGSDLAGIELSAKKWREILKDLSGENNITYEFRPIDIDVAGTKPDVWVDEALIIKKEKN